MDITAKWHSCIDNLRREKTEKKSIDHGKISHEQTFKFFDSYLKILINMNKLQTMLKANKFKYISSNERCLWFPVDQSIIEEERKKIDTETNELIEMFRNEIEVEAQIYKKLSNSNEQRFKNCEHVVLFLNSYVDSLQLIVKEQQAEYKRYSQSALDYTIKRTKSKKGDSRPTNLDNKLNKSILESKSIKNAMDPQNINLISSPPKIQNLSSNQEQSFMLENNSLLNRLETWSSQLHEVHKQILFLSEATSMMAGHVDKQAESIDNILVQAEEARDNFGRGNSNIQSAKATSSDFRLCTLVLLIFLSFSLLFLHWIN